LKLPNPSPTQIMRPIESILADYRATSVAVQEEQARRKAVMESSEYQALQVFMDAMLEGIPDSSEEHALDKAELIAYMTQNGVRQVEEFKANPEYKRDLRSCIRDV